VENYVKKIGLPSTKDRKQAILNILKNDINIQQDKIKDDLSIEVDLTEFCNTKTQNVPTIYLMAHFDVIEKISNGYNDNASSIAIILKIAEEIMREKSKTPIKLVFTYGEEIGGIGSKYFVSKIKDETESIIINLDVCAGGDIIVVKDDTKENLFAMQFTDGYIADKYAVIETTYLPFSDASITSRYIDTISISAFPEEDVPKLIGIEKGFGLEVMKYMHGSKLKKLPKRRALRKEVITTIGPSPYSDYTLPILPPSKWG